ncbi:PA0069 family radical SAM protein [Reichenbachiella sp. MALMAid0571]|uniref:PA0069 family radical SAM protein n=1 Tax=Reichenbachiella sp. MALMAid0571 TaxID=3143939 RepID=UPI0032DE3EA1
MELPKNENIFKGRGAQIKPGNRFEKTFVDAENTDGIDDYETAIPKTNIFFESPKGIVSRNDSPDLSWRYSINPYQGCEHGCVYCYARNSHEYWGFNAGMDFESKIVVKKNAAELLEKEFLKKTWKPATVMLSGNTDCYQPLEKRFGITRKLLEMFLKYQNPVGIITKNSLIKRDLDILSELAKNNLVCVAVSITSVNEELRRKMEPRTSSSLNRFSTIKILADAGIPVMVMVAPIVPGLNDHEIPKIIQKSAEAGAIRAGYTTVRLNGQIGLVFKDWLSKSFPLRAEKVWNQIESLHGGNVNDSQWGRRMRGDGVMSESIENLFHISVKKYMKDRTMSPLDTSKFRKGGNYSLF